jgi:RNA polymerase sigma-70 factor (ECF subfamily)
MRHVRRFLRQHGVEGADVYDVEQVVLLSAWRAIETGRFRPDPAMPLDMALRRWLIGIAFNKASHLRTRAHRRHEQLRGLMFDVLADAGDEDARLDAAGDLALFATLRAKLRLPVLLRAMGYAFHEIAGRLRIPHGTGVSRVGYGLARFRLLLRLRGRR